MSSSGIPTRLVASFVLLVLAGTATADSASVAPHVDPADLPPLPVAEDDPSHAATLLAATAAEEDVVVGAAKREQSLGNVASAVTVITADRIRRFGYRTIGEAVSAVAGVYLVDNRLSYSIGVRGLQVPGDFNTRILVLVDGATVNEQWGAFAGAGFDAIVGIDEIARIEVIRGPVSSLYGTNAFFGIINIVTRGAAESARAWARTGVHSINGILSSAGFAAGGVDRQVRGAVSFMDRFGDDAALPVTGDRNPDGDDSRSFTAGVVGAYDGSFLQIRAVQYRRETPFAPYDVNPAGAPYAQIDRQLLVEGGHTRELTDRFALAARAYGSSYEFTDTAPPSDPVTMSALDSRGRADTLGAELRGRYEIVVPDRLGITAGTEASYNRTRTEAHEAQTPDVSIADVPLNYSLQAAYTEVDGQPLSWLGFLAGLRYDRHSKLDDKLSPRAALFVAKPERYGVKLLYAEGFRNPSAFEAYYEDGSDFIAMPKDLEAERIRSYEGVLWGKPRPGVSVRVSGYYWDARDIIEARPSPGDPDLLQFQNVTRYVTLGAEAEASYRDRDGWFGFAGLALARVGTEEGTGGVTYGQVVNAPAVTASAGASTPRLWGVVHVSTELVVLGRRVTRAEEDGTPSPDAPTWFGWNATLYAPDVKGFDVTLGARNLLGTRDLMPAPGDYDRSVLEERLVPRVPGEGRELYVKVGYSY